MAITVSDIEQKEFAYKGAGYDPYDVDQYLDQICDEMVDMQERIDRLEAELAKARREAELAANAAQPVQPEVMEKPAEPVVAQTSQTLESILFNAQKLADGAVEDAKRKAADIVQVAQEEADAILQKAGDEKTVLETAMAEIRNSANGFRDKFVAMLEEQKGFINSKASIFDNESDD